MKKNIHSKIMCFLLVLILLIQNLAVPIFANDDGIDDYCTVNSDGRHTPVPYDIEPTCTKPGYKGGAYCSACNKELEMPGMIGELNHKETEQIDLVDPTCTEPGHTEGLRCVLCDEVLKKPEVIPAKGHEKVVTKAASEPTCIEDGNTEGWKCKVCGYEVASEVIPATGHTSVTDKAIEPTCTETGLTEGKHCSVCNEVLVKQEVVEAKGHTAEVIPAVEPENCKEEGWTEGSKCSVCGEILIEPERVFSEHKKVVTDEAVEATCRTEGRTEGWKCASCGYEVASEVIPAKGHTEVTDKAVEPTCTETGLTEGSHCSVCNEVLVAQEEVPAKGHTPEVIPAVMPEGCKEDGWTEGSKCSVCEEILVAPKKIPAGHVKVVTKEAVAATCTTEGRTEGWHCGNGCGYEVASEVIPAKGHTEVMDAAVEPTCTETGWTEGSKCSVCGRVLIAPEIIPAKGHTEEIDKAVEPTCTTSGKTEGSHCSVCGEVLKAQEDIPATDTHQLVPARGSDPNAGVLDYICKVCGKTWTGLFGSSFSTISSCEKVDWSSGDNHFSITVGDSPLNDGNAASEVTESELQVYKKEYTDSTDIICLIPEDSSAMSYISLSKDTANIGKMVITSQENPGQGIITLNPSEGVNQIGLGIDTDENGQTFLYIIEDGKECEFTILGSVPGDSNNIILETASGSRVNLESYSVGYQAQGPAAEDGSYPTVTRIEISKIRKTEEDSSNTTNTDTQPETEENEQSEFQGVEIVFGTKELESETQSTQEIKSFEENTQDSTAIGKIENDNPSSMVIEKFEEILDVVEDEEDKKEDKKLRNISFHFEPLLNSCGRCKFKKVNSKECKCKNSGCDIGGPHEFLGSEYPSEKEKCRLCGYKRSHSWTRKNGWGTEPNVCTSCDSVCYHSRWVNKNGYCTCNICGTKHDHVTIKKSDKQCYCVYCGAMLNHVWKDSENGKQCTLCKSECAHTGGWKEKDGKCVCKICGYQTKHKYEKKSNEKCKCKNCGKEEKHDWKSGKCNRCEYKCTHPKGSKEKGSGCVCKTCGLWLSHQYEKTSNDKCKCKYCGKEEKHNWTSRGIGSGVSFNMFCTNCGFQCPHRWKASGTQDACMICGVEVAHDWKKTNKYLYVCSRCKKNRVNYTAEPVPPETKTGYK